jgi:hypothetical protein
MAFIAHEDVSALDDEIALFAKNALDDVIDHEEVIGYVLPVVMNTNPVDDVVNDDPVKKNIVSGVIFTRNSVKFEPEIILV